MLFIQCLLVNFYDKGVGNQHKKGYEKALLDRALDYAQAQGVDAIAAWGTEYNGLETAAWYKIGVLQYYTDNMCRNVLCLCGFFNFWKEAS